MSRSAKLPTVTVEEIKGPVGDVLCWKRAFDTEKDARACKTRFPMRPYVCGHCGKWHLTKRRTPIR